MSRSATEPGIESGADGGTLVLFEPGSGLDAAAGELARFLGGTAGALGAGGKAAGPPAQRTLLLALTNPQLDETFGDLSARLAREGRRPPGLLVGLDADDLLARLRRFRHPEPAIGRPWLIADRTPPAAENLDCIGPGALTDSLWQTMKDRPAPFGVIVGHGREDILAFGAGEAFCGRRRSQGREGDPDCAPGACSYPQRKRSIEGLAAAVLVLLSCNAGRIGPGLMPATARLALTASATCRAVVAPRRLYTHNDALTDLVLAALLAGETAAEVVSRANAFQSARYGEDGVFLLLGDPDAAGLAAPPPATRERATAAGLLDAGLLDTGLLDAVGGALDCLDALASVGLARGEAEALRAVGEPLEALLHDPVAPAEVFASARAFLSAVAGAREVAAREAAHATAAGYFWLSSRYRLRREDEQAAACPLCGAPARRQRFGHRRRPHCVRLRLTCPVCGIVEDRPDADAPRLRLTAGAAREGAERRLRLPLSVTVGAGPAFLGLGLNGLGTSLCGVPVVALANAAGDPVPDIPALAAGTTGLCVTIDTGALRPGLYFLKLFVVGAEGAGEWSIPLPTWRAARHPAAGA
jgi:hypothetical protein